MRYLPQTDSEITEMLKVIGAECVDDLFRSVGADCRMEGSLRLPPPLAEHELDREMRRLASKNALGAANFLGGGAYRHYVPAAVGAVVNRSEFSTPYTPYQPEVSQGTLQAVFEYQTMVARITGMDIANASTYDGATSLAEACLMAGRITRKRSTVGICTAVHPEWRAVARSVLGSSGMSIAEVPHAQGTSNRAAFAEMLDENVAAIAVGYPNTFGIVEDLADIARMVHDAGALLIVCVPEPLALGLFEAPGAWGADIVVGEGMSLGMPTSFGGPTLGLFAARAAHMRQIPGRIAGMTTDADGRRGYVLTLSTREQHIRRQRATSNICSNQALCATSCAVYLSLLGKTGFATLARVNAAKMQYARRQLTALDAVTSSFEGTCFNEFVIELPKPAQDIIDALEKDMIYPGIALDRWYPEMTNRLLVSVTEMNTKEEIDMLVEKLAILL